MTSLLNDLKPFGGEHVSRISGRKAYPFVTCQGLWLGELSRRKLRRLRSIGSHGFTPASFTPPVSNGSPGGDYLNESGPLELRGLAQNAVGGPANSPSDVDALVDTLGPETRQRWYSGMLDTLGFHIEALSPSRFVLGVAAFLEVIGLRGATDVLVDGKQLQDKSALMYAADLSIVRTPDGNDLPREIEINSYGAREPFLLWVNVFYLRKHRRDQPDVEVEVKVSPKQLGPNAGESPADYRNRMKEEDVQKKILFSDLVTKISSAFPGVRLLLFERVS